MRFKSFALAAMTGFGLAALPATAGATTATLDFSGNICGAAGNAACGNGSQIGQNYGDIAGQADISYRSISTATGLTFESFLKFWTTNYGDLQGVVWGGAESVNYKSEIVFTPLAGYEISLLSFDAGCYLNRASCQTLNYAITSLGGAAIAGGATPTLHPGHASLAINSAYFSDGIKLVWGPDGYDTGLDNILFDVRAISVTPPTPGVPEPATWAMMIAGMGIVGAQMRRRRTIVHFA